VFNDYKFVQNIRKYGRQQGFSELGDWGRYSGTLLKQACAAQEAHIYFQHSSSYSFRDLSVHTDRRARLDELGLIYYTLWGYKRFLLPVMYCPTRQVYPFILQVTAIFVFKSIDK